MRSRPDKLSLFFMSMCILEYCLSKTHVAGPFASTTKKVGYMEGGETTTLSYLGLHLNVQALLAASLIPLLNAGLMIDT